MTGRPAHAVGTSSRESKKKGLTMADIERNKQIATDYLDMAFNRQQVAEAFARYVGDEYVQHNPMAPDGAAASAEFLAGFVARFPKLRLEIKRVIAEADLIVTHALMRTSPDDRGTAVVDILRIRDGRIAEHWDVAQAVPETTANNNTMF
ncbi:nuclear transport factor 2 family protein [Saccharopolyspora sp. NPDC050389]|uniref:nuclear transport factor 2 family protein n=1 Tax=Saccharopolyspora sp. NPDC050389 TaxID=3155516 RepID=UPI0033C86651